jgi:8-oxo-dGTP pyrophosphatase MutT (NUDIX family)
MTGLVRARKAVAAGGVVYRRQNGSIEVVLVGRQADRLWALPKGKPNAGETIEQTALREVSEETGLQVELADAGELGAIRYSYVDPQDGRRVDKEVHHFLMEPTGGDVAQHDHEHDVVGWYDVHDALRRVTYPNERRVLERALTALEGRAASGEGSGR